MKRSSILKVHLIATAIAVLTISTFFISSLFAELKGDVELIKMVKTGILYALPLMIIVMPVLAISGNKLAGKSTHPKVLQKQRRMKGIMINGMILISLAVYLFYHANYQTIDRTFLYVQIVELIFGFANLTLIGMNINSGLQLSGRLKADKKVETI